MFFLVQSPSMKRRHKVGDVISFLFRQLNSPKIGVSFIFFLVIGKGQVNLSSDGWIESFNPPILIGCPNLFETSWWRGGPKRNKFTCFVTSIPIVLCFNHSKASLVSYITYIFFFLTMFRSFLVPIAFQNTRGRKNESYRRRGRHTWGV